MHDGPSRVLWLRLVRLSAASSGRGAAVHVSELVYIKLSDPARIQSRPHRHGAARAPAPAVLPPRACPRAPRAPQRRGAWPGAASRSPRAAAPALTRATSARTSHHGRAPLLYVQMHACTMYMESLVHGCARHTHASLSRCTPASRALLCSLSGCTWESPSRANAQAYAPARATACSRRDGTSSPHGATHATAS